MLTAEEYLLMAYREATKSPDPSTQNGAVIPVDFEGKEYVIKAHNTFPEGVEVTPERLERPLKYEYIEHAERSAVYVAAREGLRLERSTMYVPWAACSNCARAIIRSGISRVVTHQRMLDETPKRWKESIKEAMTMLKEAGVRVVMIPGELNGPVIRFNGEEWKP